MNYNKIKSPEEVSRLMQDLYIKHLKGEKQPENNVYYVELPPLSEGELREIDKTSERMPKELSESELKEGLEKGLTKLRGW